ncbi:MAG TPA: DUF4391 domain-containing protein [Vicinamibacterales bacterium]|nr:DUF4391 domain-containing protein [Vicinamibacterales bacterium]
MTVDNLVAALDLPSAARVDRRVPKTLLVEHGAPTAADKRHINERIELLTWVAALKPATAGVPEYRDEGREYLEIAVLQMSLRRADDGGTSAGGRLIELVHRAVPYPVILIADDRGARSVSLSAAHTRWSEGEACKTVLDGEVVAVEWPDGSAGLSTTERESLALARQPRASMFAAYQGWIGVLVAMLAGRITGAFSPVPSSERTAERLAALQEWEQIEAEMVRLRIAGKKEKQISRQVELNLALKRLEGRRGAVRERLQ